MPIRVWQPASQVPVSCVVGSTIIRGYQFGSRNIRGFDHANRAGALLVPAHSPPSTIIVLDFLISWPFEYEVL